MTINFKKKSGMSLVEVIIAAAIILALSIALISANLSYLRTSNTNIKITKAVYLAEEGVEAVNFIKNNNWADLGNIGTNYYLYWTGSTWLATTTINVIDGKFERSFFTESVNRDLNDDIVLVGGATDVNTRKLTVQVSWSDNTATTTKSISAYLMKSND